MQPFKLTIDDEIFRETYNKIDADREWPCGAFHYQLKFFQKLTKEQEETLGEWLAYNCKKNFVYYKEIHYMIAGGYSDNKSAWKSRKRNKNRGPLYTYTIRLEKDDIWLFRMVWVD